MRKGLLAAVAGLLVLAAAAAAYLYSKGLHGAVLDSARVEAMARAMLPGAVPPPGSKGVLGLELDKAELAILAPSLDKASPDALQGADLRILIAAVGSADEQQSMDEVRAMLEQQKARKQAKLAQQTVGTVRVDAGGSPHPARRTTYRLVDGEGTVLEYMMLFKPADRPIVVQIMGPEATFDHDAMTHFLGPLQVPAGPGEGLRDEAGQLRDKAAELRERAGGVRDKAEEAREKAEQARDRAEEAREKAAEAREKAAEVRDEAQERAEEAREKAAEVREEAQEVRESATERLEERRERRREGR